MTFIRVLKDSNIYFTDLIFAGEQSLAMTIVNLAQNYVGSNNINLLEPRGQFGTRLCGGKDSASPRYIFTLMSPLTRLIFHPHDDPLLVVSTYLGCLKKIFDFF